MNCSGLRLESYVGGESNEEIHFDSFCEFNFNVRIKNVTFSKINRYVRYSSDEFGLVTFEVREDGLLDGIEVNTFKNKLAIIPGIEDLPKSASAFRYGLNLLKSSDDKYVDVKLDFSVSRTNGFLLLISELGFPESAISIGKSNELIIYLNRELFMCGFLCFPDKIDII